MGTTRKVTKSMEGVVKGMSAAMKSMNLEKISTLMDKFEKEFEDLDVQTSVMEGAMNQAADEAGLELNMELPGAQSATIGQSTQASTEQDELSQRLARLRQV